MSYTKEKPAGASSGNYPSIEGVTAANGFRYIAAVSDAISETVSGLSKEEALPILSFYHSVFKLEEVNLFKRIRSLSPGYYSTLAAIQDSFVDFRSEAGEDDGKEGGEL